MIHSYTAVVFFGVVELYEIPTRCRLLHESSVVSHTTLVSFARQLTLPM